MRNPMSDNAIKAEVEKAIPSHDVMQRAEVANQVIKDVRDGFIPERGESVRRAAIGTAARYWGCS